MFTVVAVGSMTHGGRPQATLAFRTENAQHSARPPGRSSHPRPPHAPHRSGQHAETPCEPAMLPDGQPLLSRLASPAAKARSDIYVAM